MQFPPYPPYPPYPQKQKRPRPPALDPLDLSQPLDEEAPEYIDEPEFEPEPGEIGDGILDTDVPVDDVEEQIPEPEAEVEPEPEAETTNTGEDIPADDVITEEEEENPWEGVEKPDLAEDEPLDDEPEKGAEPAPRNEKKPKPETPSPAERPQEVKPPEEKPPIDPFGEEAAKLYAYLKDLSQSLPPAKKEAMDKSGVSARLDAIIDRVSKPQHEPVVPNNIMGVPISPKLAKLIEFMRREKQHAGK
jgi:hypothetical protein